MFFLFAPCNYFLYNKFVKKYTSVKYSCHHVSQKLTFFAQARHVKLKQKNVQNSTFKKMKNVNHQTDN